MMTGFTNRFLKSLGASLPRLLLSVCISLFCSALFAQAPAATTQGPAATQAIDSPDENTNPVNGSTPNVTGVASRTSLTAGQIDAFLQQKPEVVVELKSLVADQLQQQGSPTQADAISDEMLYSQIAANTDLRTNITQWLWARGYITDADLHSLPAGGEDDGLSSAQTFDTLTQLPGSDFSRSGSTAALIQPGVTGNELGSIPNSGFAITTANRAGMNAGLQANSRNADSRQEPAVTDEPAVLRRPAPYNLLSLRDLYTQVPEDDARLRRFGSDVFLNRDSSSQGRSGLGPRDVPIDLPVGPDYILGPGDGITINLSGGISQSLTRVVDREGKIALPEAGSLVVAGLSLQNAQSAIESALQQQFRNAHIDITIARLRTVRVYVVGDVQRPGAYDLSSLSTPLNALYAAGGPTSVGSLRIVRHYRGKQLIREVDLYDFLLHGVRMDDERLQAGDTLLIPPAGAQVALSGMVKRPAIYELKGETTSEPSTSTLADVLADAGGVTAAAALNYITIERIQANQQRETVTLDVPSNSTPETTLKAIAAFNVKDGDRIRVAPILPYSESAIYVEGHVVRPGRYSYRDGMLLSDVVHSYQDLLPEPAAKGDIVRLVPPDLHAETIQFDVADALIGNTNLALQPFDTIRIYGRYELDSPQVTIRGEVLRPGSYALSEGMTAAQLVKMAGGFKRDALLESADLTSYTIEDGKKITSQRSSVSIGAAVKDGGKAADVSLKPGDILTIHQISGWNDIGTSIVMEGEVTYPGSYGLQEGERLSSALQRAGGFRATAYPAGAVLVRAQVRELEEKSRTELIRQIESTSASARLSPSLTGQDETAAVQAAAQQQSEVLQHLRSQPASGRLVIHVTADINSWANTDADIEMRSGDVLTVPKRPGFVLVSGQVYNASAITFVPGRDANWYLRHAGGANDVANRKDIFVIRANGSVVGRRSGEWYGSKVLSTRMEPGDVVVVPQRIIGGSLFWRNLLTVAQISSSIAITAAVAGIL